MSFFKELFVAYFFGTSRDLDLLLYALTFTSTMYFIINGAMSSTVVPNFLKFKNKDESQKNNYLASVYSIFLGISLLLCTSLYFFHVELIHLIAPGFTPDELLDISSFMKYFIVYLFLSFLGSLFQIILNANKRFFVSGLLMSITPFFIILMILIFNKLGVISIAFGIVSGAFIQYIIAFIVIRAEFNLNLINLEDLRSKYGDIFHNFSILFFGGLFIGLIDLTDQSFASLAGDGGISSLNYGNKIPALFDGLFVTVLGTVLFSTFSENIAKRRNNANKVLFVKTIKMVLVFGVIFSLILVMISKDLISIVFERGAFNQESVLKVYPIQSALFLRLPFSAMAIISARMMNSYELNKAMLMINIISFFLNAALDFILIKKFGVVGIAFATLLTYIWSASLNYIVVIRHFKSKSI
ncbi:murein biosynthesis integral membrane protein MurJ [Lutimonas zeaxanthinifaciens]|uniref:murein biosynthesis integral membrane protein MurJ n=1 Tax=Lutimonas zeaxanthinifaciens TaxID=3060215 RepID=UPI00265D2C47|nr:lipid II flippase MurJ [Lutimonas sp. YSD2104]WKK67579.1 lipid II flippase MurJ [Lutimonas sp. YSD2104]